jgi:hypothetical protein
MQRVQVCCQIALGVRGERHAVLLKTIEEVASGDAE